MTLISFIATDKFISFMSDGRVSEVETNNSVRENYRKVIKVNNAILAVGGNYNVSQILLVSINKFDTRNARALAHSMFKELGNGKVKNEMNILIGGLDEDGNIYYSGFSQDSTELTDYYPMNGLVTRLATESGESVEITNFDRLDQLIGDLQEVTLIQAKTIQEELNALVSIVDKTVGEKTFHEYIQK
ncbi:hypothetical protein [Solibacillus daqui]|uniref:hypothetical protein n=1 Tax=Solibacillus daqui TaxID=2912187 RepID=UPI002365E27A|nr:hypothetical protein [Solibacillus daqui]